MILTTRPQGLCRITQVEHGRIAGELAAHWGNSAFDVLTPRDAVVFAATHHDEGWRSRDAIPLMNEIEGRPLHFLEIAAEDHTRLYRDGIDWISARDAYAGLLVGMHWTGLYRGRWARADARGRLGRTPIDEQVLDDVVAAEELRWIGARREAWAQWAVDQPRAAFETTLWHNYGLLQLWDLLSLYFCVMPAEPSPEQSPSPWGPQLKSLEHSPEPITLPAIRTAPFGEPVEVRARVVEPGVVTVEPWPFAAPQFGLEIEQSGATTKPVGWMVRRTGGGLDG